MVVHYIYFEYFITDKGKSVEGGEICLSLPFLIGDENEAGGFAITTANC